MSSGVYIRTPEQIEASKKRGKENGKKMLQEKKGIFKFNGSSWNKDKKLSAEHIKNKTGWKQTEETKQIIREARLNELKINGHFQKGKTYEEMYGEERTKEIKEKMLYKVMNSKLGLGSNQEKILRQELLKENINFIKHKPILNIKHRYNCDIFIPSANIVIECDGDYWHHYPNGNEIDWIRNREMYHAGYKVLRFWEHEIKNDLQGCVNDIKEYLKECN